MHALIKPAALIAPLIGLLFGCVSTDLPPAEEEPEPLPIPVEPEPLTGAFDGGQLDLGRDQAPPDQRLPDLPDAAVLPFDHGVDMREPDAAPLIDMGGEGDIPDGECIEAADCLPNSQCFGLSCQPAALRCYCRLDGRTLIPSVECSFWGMPDHRDRPDSRDPEGRTYAQTRARYEVACTPPGHTPTGQPCVTPLECQGAICLFTGSDPHRCSEECADGNCPPNTVCGRNPSTGMQLCIVP